MCTFQSALCDECVAPVTTTKTAPSATAEVIVTATRIPSSLSLIPPTARKFLLSKANIRKLQETSSNHYNHHFLKDYVVISLIITLIQYYVCYNCNPSTTATTNTTASNSTKSVSTLLAAATVANPINNYRIIEEQLLLLLFSRNQNYQSKMNERLNIGHEVRELKLGSTFSPQNSQTAFHTIKYDFKPASVDLNRVATLDVGSNNQVTVTVPNIESSGVPHTVFKGNQRKYTKECIIIFDKKTGVMTLEKLNHNIQVKKTRSETTNKNVIPPPPPQKLENNTQRTSSKTRVSTGIRKNAIIGFIPRNSPMQAGSPSTVASTNHKSPQSAPAWNANNAQSTLPSIPLIEVDEDLGMPSGSGLTNNSSMNANAATTSSDFHHQQQMSSTMNLPMQQQQQQQQYQNHNQNNSHHQHGNSNNLSSLSNNIASGHHSIAKPDRSLENAAAALEQNMVGVLSSSDSSSDSDSSGSGSDSDDSADDNDGNTVMQTTATSLTAQKGNLINNQKYQHNNNSSNTNNQQQSFTNGVSSGGAGFPALLHDDLQLSESNSSSSDSDDSGDDDDDD